MTMTNTGATPVKGTRGRAMKFTPQAIEQIKEFIAQGKSRDEVANLLGVTVGSLQVTCSRLGISLRRNVSRSGLARHTLDARRRSMPTPGADMVARAHEQRTEEASWPKFAITLRHRGKEVTTEVPLTSQAIKALALHAMWLDLGAAELLGRVLDAVVRKDMVQEILKDEAA
jgi:hypothetical protein